MLNHYEIPEHTVPIVAQLLVSRSINVSFNIINDSSSQKDLFTDTTVMTPQVSTLHKITSGAQLT